MREVTKIQPLEVGELPLKFRWVTYEGMDKAQLFRNMCDDGRKSRASKCHKCISQCAFGREYIKKERDNAK